MLRLIGVLFVLAVFIAGAALGYYNNEPVTLYYLLGTLQTSVAALVVSSFIAAALVTLAVCSLRMLGLHREIRRLRRQLADAETELKNLRNLPVAPAPR